MRAASGRLARLLGFERRRPSDAALERMRRGRRPLCGAVVATTKSVYMVSLNEYAYVIPFIVRACPKSQWSRLKR